MGSSPSIDEIKEDLERLRKIAKEAKTERDQKIGRLEEKMERLFKFGAKTVDEAGKKVEEKKRQMKRLTDSVVKDYTKLKEEMKVVINTQEIRQRFNTLKAHRNILESELAKNRDLLEKSKERHENALKARTVIQEVAQATQENIEGMVNEVVTLALRSIPFDENYDFKAEFVQRRNKTECDLWFVTDDGEKIHPLSSTGGGVCDVASLALLFVFKKLSGKRKTLIVDEPLKHLSKNYHEDASEMIHSLCERLQIQVIMVTHLEDIISGADKVIELK